jgi:hypothetical protein
MTERNVYDGMPWVVFRATRILMLEVEQATQMFEMADPEDDELLDQLAEDVRHIEADMRALHGEWVVA